MMGRMTLGRLEVVISTIHLKMKFYSDNDDVVTLDVDIPFPQSCYSKANLRERTASNTEVNLAYLDARYKPHSSDNEEDNILAKELKKKITRPELDGQFLPIQFGYDPRKVIMIGSDLFDEVKTALVKCLRNYADLFAWSVADMP